MKIELQAGDVITIPQGCKAIIKDGKVVFEKEVFGFKDGDILISNLGIILIFKKYIDYGVFTSYYNTVNSNNRDWYTGSFHHATEEEKQLLFDKMKEQGLKWNAKEKKVEKIRWRARGFGEYYRMGLKGEVFLESDRRSPKDEVFYDTLNYFRTEEFTKEAGKRVKETLRKYHEEIGE